ncbi:MAG TPA: LytTR family DNA-binding domain-containing protein [Thermoclostridium caenicola]|uniref:LytR/AlgR family response regulator transcription factor n=1 Tax=Thermoclostridium caenicola TaxID=659425 RepID=UPI002C556662|nr:LytTR family DNA-binding domain-containing protein [Thermoclostridium caenicola]HOK43896.1 LytTR family DNA-binding domain-containing protein [Thermoclostridium caenicola]HOL84001.1 LytTR family DNA-binding domain-containing protein [Thermoclostridium caenicola]HPO76030.1 LytTR family DNA-binding domain-containing protein [Thermoclostridium caenicola]
MPINILICDDTAEDSAQLTEALYAYDHTFNIITYSDGQALLDDFPELKHSIDILFLDIYMPGLDGIKTAEKIRNERRDIKIIFTTTSNEHYPQAYELFAFNYIVKPVEREKLYRILDQAIFEIRRDTSQRIRFSYKSTMHSVDCRDILYIESRNKLLLFHKTCGEILQCYGKLDAIEKELPPESFIRCHQSFIVNAAFITEMGENYFRVGQVAISISKKNLKQAKEQYYAYLFSHMGKGLSS